MAKDNRKILRGVRTDGKVYGKDMEDELAENKTQEQLDALKAKGAIEGDWKAMPKPAHADKPDARRDANAPTHEDEGETMHGKKPQHQAFAPKPASKPSDSK